MPAFTAPLLALCSPDLFRLLECDGVHAVAQAAWFRTIRKNVSQMRVTGVADRFNPLQEARAVETIGDRVGLERLRERRPAGVGLELFVGVEKQRLATQAGIDPWREQTAHLGAERAFRACLPGHAILFRAQLLAPLRFRLDDLVVWSRISVLSEGKDIGPGQHDNACEKEDLMERRIEFATNSLEDRSMLVNSSI